MKINNVKGKIFNHPKEIIESNFNRTKTQRIINIVKVKKIKTRKEPLNITKLVKKDKKSIIEYSERKIRINKTAPYSTLKPLTSSLSLSPISKQPRIHSIKITNSHSNNKRMLKPLVIRLKLTVVVSDLI